MQTKIKETFFHHQMLDYKCVKLRVSEASQAMCRPDTLPRLLLLPNSGGQNTVVLSEAGSGPIQGISAGRQKSDIVT